MSIRHLLSHTSAQLGGSASISSLSCRLPWRLGSVGIIEDMDKGSRDVNHKKLLQEIASSSEQLLRSCAKLGESLPARESQFASRVRSSKQHKKNSNETDDGDLSLLQQTKHSSEYLEYLNEAASGFRWPTLLGDFRTLAEKLADLGSKGEDAKLKRVVVVPTDSAPQPNGMPSMFM